MIVASLAYKLKYNEEWGGGLSNGLKKQNTNKLPVNEKFAVLTENDICFRESLILNIAIMIMPFLLFDEKVLLKLICENQFTNNLLEWSPFKYVTFSKNLIFQHLSLSMNMPI